MNAGDAHQMGAAGGVEVVQIRNVLEVVGVLLAVLNSGVGNHIVAVLVDLQVDALLGQNGYALLQDLGVGRGRSGHVQGDSLLSIGGLLGLSVVSGGVVSGVSFLLPQAARDRARDRASRVARILFFMFFSSN